VLDTNLHADLNPASAAAVVAGVDGDHSHTVVPVVVAAEGKCLEEAGQYWDRH
jgi:hypothetical protein